jgi:hypothetical protein
MAAMSALVMMGAIAVGCGGGGSGGSGGSGGGAAICSTMADCADGTVCLITGGLGLCQLDCSLNASECSAEASCSGVGSLSVSVCQEPAETAPEEATEDDIPYIPCATDADCQALDPIAICAQFQGRKDCTIPCSNEGEKAECNLPPLFGVALDFMICNPDEADTTRLACLPDEACFASMMSCMDLGDFGGNTGGDFGFEDFGEDF